jgi:hypothetical protein
VKKPAESSIRLDVVAAVFAHRALQRRSVKARNGAKPVPAPIIIAGSDLLCIALFVLPTFTSRRLPGAISLTPQLRRVV